MDIWVELLIVLAKILAIAIIFVMTLGALFTVVERKLSAAARHPSRRALSSMCWA